MGLVVGVVALLLVAGGVALLVRGRVAMSQRFSFPILRRVRVEDQREMVHAIAVWTENLRDAISASTGLEQAISSTARHSPQVIEPHLQALIASMKYRSLEDSLRDFAAALSHPTSDFVVVSLLTSLRHPTRDLVSLLSHLSECARAECDLYLRIWVSRARSRAAVRIINWSVAVFTLGLVLFQPGYISPFFTTQGFFFLVVIGICFSGGLLWLRQFTTLDLPNRFLESGVSS